MKTDQNGCSTCPVGEERYEQFTHRFVRRGSTYFQYDYRDFDGELFSTVAPTLERCRTLRDQWKNRKTQLITDN